MKKLIPFLPFLMLLIFFSYACEKGTESQTAEEQTTIDKQNYSQLQVVDRASCCCDVVVSSAYFEGMTICGVLVGDTCVVSSSCGNTCGNSQVVPAANKTALFCWNDTCPVCFYNPGSQTITIYFDCLGGESDSYDIVSLGTRCFTGDCDGNFTPCN